MLKSEKKSSALQKTLKLINKCPICNTTYKKDSKNNSISAQNTHLVHLTCSKCHGYFLAVVLEISKGTSTVGMVTDLNFDDLQRLYTKEQITLDEVIAGCKFLKQKNLIKKLTK